jgi:hypothetical protein
MSPQVEEQTISAWRNTIRVESVPTLVPGQRIVVTIVTAGGSENVHQEIVVGHEPIQDVKLMFGSQ